MEITRPVNNILEKQIFKLIFFIQSDHLGHMVEGREEVVQFIFYLLRKVISPEQWATIFKIRRGHRAFSFTGH